MDTFTEVKFPEEMPSSEEIGYYLRTNPWATHEDIAKHFSIPLEVAQWCMV